MKIAIQQAQKGKKRNEVPVGAIIVDQNFKIIAKAHNQVEKFNNSIFHAEKIVIEKALKKLRSRYLNNCYIWVTLEPCIMCASLIKQTRIKRLYFGAEDIKNGAIINGNKIFSNTNSKLEIYHGFQEDECKKIIRDFFTKLR